MGAIVAVAFARLGVAARTPGAARVGAATVFSIWSVASGLLGVILTLLWTVTDHRFAHPNENLLLFNPLWLVLAVTLPMTILRERAVWMTNRLLLIVFALGALALAAHLVGLSRQANLPIIGLGVAACGGTDHRDETSAKVALAIPSSLFPFRQPEPRKHAVLEARHRGDSAAGDRENDETDPVTDAGR